MHPYKVSLEGPDVAETRTLAQAERMRIVRLLVEAAAVEKGDPKRAKDWLDCAELLRARSRILSEHDLKTVGAALSINIIVAWSCTPQTAGTLEATADVELSHVVADKNVASPTLVLVAVHGARDTFFIPARPDHRHRSKATKAAGATPFPSRSPAYPYATQVMAFETDPLLLQEQGR